MPAFDLFTIGHSNSPAQRFVGLLRGAGVDDRDLFAPGQAERLAAAYRRRARAVAYRAPRAKGAKPAAET